MKKKIAALTVIIFLIALFGCSKEEQKLNNQPIVSEKQISSLKSTSIPGQKTFLKYKFEKGEKIRYKLTSLSSTEQTIKADSSLKSTGTQTLTYFFDIEVLEVDADNIAELSFNITQVIYDGIINGQKTHYDSKSVLTKEEKAKYIDFETITNTPFRERVNQKGEVLEITRLDKMVDKMISVQPDMQKMTGEQKAQLIKNLGDGELKPRTQLLFRELTSSEVGKDSTWQKSTPATIAVFQMDNAIRYKVADFVKVDDDYAVKLNADLAVKWTGNKKASNNGINYLFDDPKVSGGGMILFNIDKGRIIRGETTTNIEMNVQITGKDAAQKIQKASRKDFSTNKNTVELL